MRKQLALVLLLIAGLLTSGSLLRHEGAAPRVSPREASPKLKPEEAAAQRGVEETRDAGHYDVIIYGGGPQAVAAALQFSAATRRQASVLMIVPERAFGSVLTIGRQNLFDVNYYEPKRKPSGVPKSYQGSQAGTLLSFLRDLSPVFPPERMERYLEERIRGQGSIRYRFETDLTSVQAAPDGTGGWAVHAVTFRHLTKDASGHYQYDLAAVPETASATVVIDASESGKLVTLTGYHTGTVGREDQNPDKHQMAATLMFKLKGIDASRTTQNGKIGGQVMSDKGSFQFWGGYEVRTFPAFLAYEQGAHPFRIKPFNAGEDGYAGNWKTDNLSFWMNMLLVYDVDATRTMRDEASSGGAAAGMASGIGLDPETARDMAAAEVAKPEFMALLRGLPGFESAELVMKDGRPETGEMLYIRESIHSANYADPVNRQYAFALDKHGVIDGDAGYFARRIGLGYYHFDSNSYRKGEQLSNPIADKPWYVPYEVLVDPKLSNVLVPGYAANMDSFAWTAMRVYPNLIMLGDAAGVAAALAVQGDFRLNRPTDRQILLLQSRLRQANVILDK